MEIIVNTSNAFLGIRQYDIWTCKILNKLLLIITVFKMEAIKPEQEDNK